MLYQVAAPKTVPRQRGKQTRQLAAYVAGFGERQYRRETTPNMYPAPGRRRPVRAQINGPAPEGNGPSRRKWFSASVRGALVTCLPMTVPFESNLAKVDIAALGARGEIREWPAALLSQPCRGPATSRAVSGTRHSNAAIIQKAVCSPTAFETKPMAAGPASMPR
jgi:hypothetical protein